MIDPLTSDDALVDRARSGDTAAYEELVRRYQDVGFRTAYLITRGAAEAEEATQDAFMKAYAALPRFIHGAPFRPWLLRIVANESRNRRRASSRREALGRRVEQASEARPDGAGAPSGAAPSPEMEVIARERRSELLVALERLPEPDRLVISARYLLELSEAEAADLLGVPRGTVKSRLSRALERLRDGYRPTGLGRGGEL